MVTDQYSHILDESRRNNAQLFEQAFYGGKGVKIVPEAQDKAVEEQVQQAGLIQKCCSKFSAIRIWSLC